jgi:hypothetical protein
MPAAFSFFSPFLYSDFWTHTGNILFSVSCFLPAMQAVIHSAGGVCARFMLLRHKKSPAAARLPEKGLI